MSMNLSTSKRVGLVDDDEAVRFAIKTLLNVYQYDVEMFESAEALLQVESLEDFDCLIIDFRLRGLSGLQLMRELEERGSRVPIVVVSGYTSATESLQLNAAGAAAIMHKPINAKDFFVELSRITQASGSQ
jgi:two-component system response regulator FixJ